MKTKTSTHFKHAILKAILFFLLTSFSFAQTPQSFNYQAVIRDASDALLLNQSIGVELILRENSSTGAIAYTETHTTTTNSYGILNLSVGTGTTSDDFTSIDWQNNLFWLQISVDLSGGTSYALLGSQQLTSVPFALTALRVQTGNSMDEAYDEGASAGDGRKITADSGSLEITGVGSRGLEVVSDPDYTGIYVAGSTALDQTAIFGSGSGDAYGIWGSNDGTASSLYGFHSGVGEGLRIFQSGAGKGAFVNNVGTGIGIDIFNSNPANGDEALKVVQAGDGIGIAVANTNSTGTEDALKVLQAGTGNAVFVDNAGVGIGMEIFNGNPTNASNALRVAQGGTGTAAFISNDGTAGSAAFILNGNPTNADTVLTAETFGTGGVGVFTIGDNNANSSTTLEAINGGSGSVATFFLDDELVGKANSSPAVNINTNGKGPGLNISIGNTSTGADGNMEPAINSVHSGLGNAGYFKTTKTTNASATLEVLNESSGDGIHILMPDIGISAPGTALYVEQETSSLSATKGRAAHFDLAKPFSLADSAVLITSAASDSGHSALRVIPASPADLAASFEGDVEISSDLTTIGKVSAGSALVSGLLEVTTISNGTATIDHLIVTTSITAPAKAFKIDHPLEPENKFLYHNSIESNERINIYNDNITTDEKGYHKVQLPTYMSALNGHFKYQLTVLDKSFAQAIVWEPIDEKTNTFIIKTNAPYIKVSWQVTGVRIDKWSKDNPMKVEVAK